MADTKPTTPKPAEPKVETNDLKSAQADDSTPEPPKEGADTPTKEATPEPKPEPKDAYEQALVQHIGEGVEYERLKKRPDSLHGTNGLIHVEKVGDETYRLSAITTKSDLLAADKKGHFFSTGSAAIIEQSVLVVVK